MKFRYAVVCSSNQNRSMEAHSLLKRQGFDVCSYGTGAHVKLPGPSLREPNVYDFGTPYKQMLDDLRRKDQELYKRNGILPMLKRNSTVKLAPQRWQDNANEGSFDIVFTFEEKVFDMVAEGICDEFINRDSIAWLNISKAYHFVDKEGKINDRSQIPLLYKLIVMGPLDLHNRDHVLMKTVLLIINLEVKDNHEEAFTGARLTLDPCQDIEAVESREESIDDIFTAFEKQHRRKLLYSASFC